MPPTHCWLLLAVLARDTIERSHAWEIVKDGSAWQQSDVPWKPHTGSVAVPVSDGRVFLVGGQAGEHGGALFDCYECTNEVWSFQPVENQWKNLSDNVPWDPRWGHSAAVTPDDNIWLLFGCCARGQPTVMLKDVWTFNPVKGTPWTQATTNWPFEAIQAPSISTLGDDIWITGGWSMSRGTLSEVAVFHTKSLTWTVISDHDKVPWKHRADHASAISPDGRWLFVYSGQHRNEVSGHWWRLSDTWRVELPEARTNSWQRLGDFVGARSSTSFLVLQTGWLLITGGHWTPDDETIESMQENTDGMKDHHRKTAFKTYNDIQALNIGAGGEDGWKTIEPQAPWPSRDDMANVVSSNGSLLLFGGGTRYGGGGYLKDVVMLPDPVTTFKLFASRDGKAKADEL